MVLWIWITASALFLFIFLLIYMKITVIFDLKHVGDDDEIKVKFKAIFGILKYTIKIPLVKVDPNGPNILIKEEKKMGGTSEPKEIDEKISPNDMLASIKDFKELTEHIVHLNKIVRKFLSHVQISKFKWHSQLGTGDAATTGMIIGPGWTLKGSVVGIISSYMKLKSRPNLSIEPNFYQKSSKTNLSCMLHFRIGHAIVAGIRLLKYWRGGRPTFINQPFSFLSKEKKNKSA
ncbi:DUF2953 domain-containing protein [Bacillus sp. UMB0893]|uniref:DUF2953 domain-containing protein n=1 Tax=Bacillus sp. UMB0893 TaxID=2066053 RepID=UPI000C779548|nr:DUF2953 domain-containing protein [Bacillus sp. UMB0893]PLR68417.1 hypothetical protein CYJ36_09980 [Bacillus sp. UMB0893]